MLEVIILSVCLLCYLAFSRGRRRRAQEQHDREYVKIRPEWKQQQTHHQKVGGWEQ